jgi:hypothetical protein
MEYMRSDHDQERISKLYNQFGTGVFTAPEVEEKCFPDFTSGVIKKWGNAGVLVKVGETLRVQTRSKNRNRIGIWKLTKSAIRNCQRWSESNK